MAKPKNTSKQFFHKWLKVKPNGSLLIRFKYQSKLYQFAPVTRGSYTNTQDVAIANRVASEIEQAVKLGTFEGLDKWKPKRIQEATTSALTTINDIWEEYMAAKADKVSKASQKSLWVQVDSCLRSINNGKVLGNCLVENFNGREAIQLLQKEYAPSVVARALEDLHAACNLALKQKLIPVNPLEGYKDYLPDRAKSKRAKECYSLDEVNLIIEAFRELQNMINPRLKHLKPTCYADFVEFLFLTGVRPQLAIALTWGDVKDEKIIFNKGFTKGVLTEGKTGRETHYPLYPQLMELMTDMLVPAQTGYSNDNLVFPSPTGKHIDLHNFTSRIWKPLITNLVKQGKLSKYLPTYHCRHSTATFLAKAGLPMATIAALLDTSEAMLNKHYLDNQELTNVEIPNLLGR